MRKIAEIRHDLSAKVAEIKACDVTNKELLEKLIGEMDALTNELNAANKVEAAAQLTAQKDFDLMQKDAKRRFSLIKFFNELSTKGASLSGLEAEVAELGAKEYERLGLTKQGAVIPTAFLRAAAGQNAGTLADGGNLIETMDNKYLESLKERLVITKLGATVLMNLVGDLPLISSTSIVGGWGDEAAEAALSKIQFSKAIMKPHRNFVAGAVTKDLLRQTSLDVEAMLLRMITDEHARLLDKAAICGTGASGEPTGILANSNVTTLAMGTNGAAINWAKIVDLETTVNANNANRGQLGYLTNSKVLGLLKKTEKSANTAKFLLDENKILNGYPIEWTNLVPSNLTKGTGTALSAMIFGNFNDLYAGEWGGLDIVIDPYTKAASAQILYTLNAWNDAMVAEAKSFAIVKDIVTD